jgi:hypothetical protein
MLSLIMWFEDLDVYLIIVLQLWMLSRACTRVVQNHLIPLASTTAYATAA